MDQTAIPHNLAPKENTMKRETMLEVINQITADRMEYEETHRDAGGGYAQLPAEGDYDYNRGDDRLDKFLTLNKIDRHGLSTDQVSAVVLDSFHMDTGHAVFPSIPDNVFEVGVYPVGEIEIEMWDAIKELHSDARWDVYCDIADSNDADAFLDGTGRAYQESDVAWLAVISAEDIQEAIAGQAE